MMKLSPRTAILALAASLAGCATTTVHRPISEAKEKRVAAFVARGEDVTVTLESQGEERATLASVRNLTLQYRAPSGARSVPLDAVASIRATDRSAGATYGLALGAVAGAILGGIAGNSSTSNPPAGCGPSDGCVIDKTGGTVAGALLGGLLGGGLGALIGYATGSSETLRFDSRPEPPERPIATPGSIVQ